MPVELEYKAWWALKNLNFDINVAREKRKIQLQELEKLKVQAYDSTCPKSRPIMIKRYSNEHLDLINLSCFTIQD